MVNIKNGNKNNIQIYVDYRIINQIKLNFKKGKINLFFQLQKELEFSG